MKLYWLVAGIAAFVLYFNLGVLPLDDWDEARYTLHVLDMFDSGHWLFPHLNGSPDLRMIEKPVVGMWLMGFFMAILGNGEMGARAASATAGFACVLMIFFFLRSQFSQYAALLGAIFLLTSLGFIGYHGARSGDLDVILTAFTTGSSICFYQFCRTRQTGMLMGGAFLTMMAILTKSIAGLFALIAFIIFLCFDKSTRQAISLRKLVYMSLVVCVPVLIWLSLVILTIGDVSSYLLERVTQRVTTPADGHVGPWYFYFIALKKGVGVPWLIAITSTVLPTFFVLSRQKLFFKYWGIFLVVFYGIISAVPTKLEWYLIPCYPLVAILLGGSAHEILILLRRKSHALAQVFVIFLATVSLFKLGKAIEYVTHQEARLNITNSTLSERGGYASNYYKRR